jgi:Zn-dependent protease
MQSHWDLGRIGGLPVSMHWTVLMAFPWLFLWTRSLTAAAIGTVAFLALMLAHEFGHVLAARWRKIPAYSIELQGLHGQTERGYPRSAKDEVIVAWGGVAAQLLILAATYAVTPLLEQVPSALFWIIVGPIVLVWTQWNIFLTVVALLPIGPMDGHAAWRVLPMIRDAFRRNRKSGKVVKLSAARKKQLNEDSERKVVEILDRLKKK